VRSPNLTGVAEPVRVGELTVRVTCLWCGDIALDGTAVQFRFDALSGDFDVAFRCDRCGTEDSLAVRRPERLAALFAAGLVPAVRRGHDDPAVTDAFRAWLDEPGALEADVARWRDA
jgi:hypothetical protein